MNATNPEVVITTRNMHKFTEQQVYDYVVGKLRKQARSSRTANLCCYRLDRSKSCKIRCAAGHLIHDDDYSSGWEGNGWHALVSKGIVPNHHQALIESLQSVHDSFPHQGWENTWWGFPNTAARFNLIYTPPTDEA